MSATYDGAAIFGLAVKIRMTPNPPAEQRTAFFGVTGQLSLYGGGRGRMFSVDGVLFGETVADLNAAEALLLSYADGVASDLEDTRGRVWPQVLLLTFQPAPKVLQDPRGFYLPYQATLAGLI